MRQISISFKVLPLLVCLILAACGGTGSALKPGAQVPYTKFETLDGDYLLLNSLKGRYVALLFWATTCRNSKGEIEEFNSEAAALAGRDDVEFIAVSVDEFKDRDNLEAMVRNRGLNSVTHAFSGNGAYDEAYIAFRCEYIPQSFLIGPDGKVIASDNDLNFPALLK